MLFPPSDVRILVCCVYMPCDTSYDLTNRREFLDVLNEMTNLAASHSVNHMICCGDFNTDFNRVNSLHTEVLVNIFSQENLCNFQGTQLYKVDYTFESFVDGSRSILDHVFLSENLKGQVKCIHTVHSPEDMSDHCPLLCELIIPRFADPPTDPQRRSPSMRPKWSGAPSHVVDEYRAHLSTLCDENVAPNEVTSCHDVPCNDWSHRRALQNYHDYLVAACTVADHVIPKGGGPQRKRIPGWAEHVKPLHQRALFWHAIWTQCGRPPTGAVADVRCHTRRLYHKATKHAATWKKVQKMKNSAAQHPNSVNGARSDVEIVSVFKQKYSNLYNSVGYDHRVLDDTRDRVNELISSHEASDCHAITLHEAKTAVSQLKRNKHDGLAGISTDHLKNAPQPFLSHLTTFFNGLLTHGFSPDDFNVAVLISIPKNKRKSLKGGRTG
ncbi:hypothetical protein CAPTEDRAFT_203516 [Capitella teleta]|uniref:Endonuclease/exonuclease/phosphatase domain-containing protein n=1 Tax=Capitella teleta TaxID=283909 RepID=R7V6H4_CAPTE|nr:hypothetical protein CAPTEDRAFT_203516 [Capitella teleta]|eukprot:ELU14159.1 hypothetical protein CAPTEDRAFT_203516 [Capitella teleta]